MSAHAILTGARRRFYELDGPWHRCRLLERLGSQRYSRPALFNMDVRLAELMPWRDGTFFEAGAHDGYTQSNTYYLERYRGWSGILVEPIPQLRRKCERRRPRSRVFGCALVGQEDGEGRVTIRVNDLMSHVSRADRAGDGGAAGDGFISVPARTLTSVLDAAAARDIDLMVLDLEGQESEVLRGLDLDRLHPRYMLIEALERARQQGAIDAALASHYEFVEPLSDYDLLYKLRD
ncbi:MAG TPA: FkbM family methyltransferase [Solirubrobacteraceae bacterium]|nr:FkbM family methyltransferase [Solirubrobacteraceae bacterium]